jgi:hypothetical protein
LRGSFAKNEMPNSDWEAAAPGQAGANSRRPTTKCLNRTTIDEHPSTKLRPSWQPQSNPPVVPSSRSTFPERYRRSSRTPRTSSSVCILGREVDAG